MDIGTEVVRKYRKDPDPVFGVIIQPDYELLPGLVMVRWNNGLTMHHYIGELRPVREEDKPYIQNEVLEN